MQVKEQRHVDALFSLVYEELRRLASRVRRSYPHADINSTALVDEAWIKLRDSPELASISLAHFKNTAAYAMKQVLVEQARRRMAAKRGFGRLIVQEDPTAAREIEAVVGQVWATNHATDQAAAVLTPLINIAASNDAQLMDQREALTALATTETDTGHARQAFDLEERALTIDERLHGKFHPRVAEDLGNLATATISLLNLPQAETFERRAVNILQSWYGTENPQLLEAQSVLATILSYEHKLDEAAALLQKVIPLQEKVMGDKSEVLVLNFSILGNIARQRKDFPNAEKYAQRSLVISKSLYGGDDFATAVQEGNLGGILLQENKNEEAAAMLGRALYFMESHPTAPSNLAVTRISYGDVLTRLKRYREALKPLEEGYAWIAGRKDTPGIIQQNAIAEKDLKTVHAALENHVTH